MEINYNNSNSNNKSGGTYKVIVELDAINISTELAVIYNSVTKNINDADILTMAKDGVITLYFNLPVNLATDAAEHLHLVYEDDLKVYTVPDREDYVEAEVTVELSHNNTVLTITPGAELKEKETYSLRGAVTQAVTGEKFLLSTLLGSDIYVYSSTDWTLDDVVVDNQTDDAVVGTNSTLLMFPEKVWGYFRILEATWVDSNPNTMLTFSALAQDTTDQSISNMGNDQNAFAQSINGGSLQVGDFVKTDNDTFYKVTALSRDDNTFSVADAVIAGDNGENFSFFNGYTGTYGQTDVDASTGKWDYFVTADDEVSPNVEASVEGAYYYFSINIGADSIYNKAGQTVKIGFDLVDVKGTHYQGEKTITIQ